MKKSLLIRAIAVAGMSFVAVLTNAGSIPDRCVMNSDCIAGMACHSGLCGVECREDRDCGASGLLSACVATSTSPSIAENVGGGLKSKQCVPRAGFSQQAPLPQLYPILSDSILVGEDFWTFANFHQDPQVCALECARFKNDCKAWVMFDANVKGPHARCLLKKNVTSVETNQGGATSGYVD